MGGLLSKYAGSNDIASFATLVPDSSEGLADPEPKEYDYVILGGGTAGCVLASRLSENPDITVLVVEAGESDARVLHSKIPAGLVKLQKSAVDWDFQTTPQAGLGGRELSLPRGKMLGGCSAINAQIYQHCAPADFDDWEKKGAPGWGFKDLKPYFRKAERFTPNPDYNIDLDERGNTGVWNTSYPPTTDISKALIQAGINVGIPANSDHNVERNAAGISRFQATIDSGGSRSSTSAAYLTAEVTARPNLSILTSTTITRLLLEEQKGGEKSVKAVELAQSQSGPRYLVKAAKEVLLCLGSYNSPQLLLASGIGSAEELGKIGVDVEVEIDGVGRGLKDHLMAGPVYKAAPGSGTQYLISDLKAIPALVQWLYNGKGPLASNGAEVGAFLRSDNIPGGGKSSVPSELVNASGPNAPDLELLNIPCHYMNHARAKMSDTSNDYHTIFAVNLRPRSVGTVTCRSGNMFESPVIDHNYLSDKDGYDQRVLLEGLKLIRRIGRTAPLAEYHLEVDVPAGFDNLGDKELLDHIKDTAETIYHPMCTCKIGPKDDGGVVDTDLFVHGVQNLRICDASIFPDILSGHPQAAVVACAERLSDMLAKGH